MFWFKKTIEIPLEVSKEITDKLEELRNIGTDEAAIEAGKLLAEQIIENTIDNTRELLHDS